MVSRASVLRPGLLLAQPQPGGLCASHRGAHSRAGKGKSCLGIFQKAGYCNLMHMIPRAATAVVPR